MSNIALTVKEYGSGRLCISTDRIGGFNTGHGDNTVVFWRSLLEWLAQKTISESINIGVVGKVEADGIRGISRLTPVTLESISLHDLLFEKALSYDIIYFHGNPSLVDNEAQLRIKELVIAGAGVLVEPDTSGVIEVLEEIDSITVDSVNRPTEGLAYWTETGQSHELYDTPIYFSFLRTIDSEQIPEDWDILLTDITAQLPPEELITFSPIGQIGAEFGISYACKMKDGLVMIKETADIIDGSSSSSIESSSESSSMNDDRPWSFCDDIVARWKMNDNLSSPVVWDISGNVSQMGELQNNLTTINTEDRSVNGKINRALELDGSTEFINTLPNTSLNFVDANGDKPFSVAIWCYIKDVTSGYLLQKQDVWHLYLVDGRIFCVLQNEGASRIKASNPAALKEDQWNHITLTYDGVDLDGINIYHNGNLLETEGFEIDYTEMSNADSPLDIGFAGTSFLKGAFDDIIIIDREFTPTEIEGLYNEGYGTEACDGVVVYNSSSSSDSSDSSDSSSSSIDSSSSSSSLGNSSSSSSSSSSLGYSESSSGGYSESSSSFEYSSSSSQSISSSSSSSADILSDSSESINNFSSSSSSGGYSESSESSASLSSESSSSSSISSSSSSSAEIELLCFDIDTASPTACELTDFDLYGVTLDNSDYGTLWGHAVRSGPTTGYALYKDELMFNLVATGYINTSSTPGTFDINEAEGSGIYGTGLLTSDPPGNWDRLFKLRVFNG